MRLIRLQKRKLKSWIDNQHKVKGVKGRKTNDPNRDQALYDWCLSFQRDYNRAPTRKEATKKALEISEDSTFQASKGWLDKFSRKYNIEFTPLKTIPGKNKMSGSGFLDSDSGSFSDASSYEGVSPTIQGSQFMQPQQQGNGMKPWNLEEPFMMPNGQGNEFKPHDNQINSFLSFNNSTFNESMQQEKKDTIPFLDQQWNQQPINNDFGNLYGFAPDYQQNGFQMNFQNFPQGNNQGGFMNNSQPQFEVNNFLNFDTFHDNNNGEPDFRMKMENLY